MPDPAASAPSSFTAGDTVSWYQDAGETPPPTWALRVFLTGPSSLEVVATNASGRHLVTFPAADTTELAPGAYRWTARVTSGAEAYVVASGTVEVLADPARLAGNAGQSMAERHLAAIEAALGNRWTSDLEEYEIAGRRLKKTPLDVLVRLRAQFAAEVRRERRGGRVGTPALVEFTRTGFA